MRHGKRVNVGTAERWASLLGGGALIARGLSRRGVGGIATAVLGGALVRRGASGHCNAYERLGISTAEPERAERGGLDEMLRGHDVRVESVVTIDRPAEDLYRIWRDPDNLPRFMSFLESVRDEGNGRTHWTYAPPVGPEISFDTEVTDDVAPDRIAWRSVDSAVVRHTGSVDFRSRLDGRGTEVRLRLAFSPPGGALGAGIAGLFDGAVETALRADLKKFKQLAETGEIATTDGQPSGRATS
jgi:uncharacterized membrane protein